MSRAVVEDPLVVEWLEMHRKASSFELCLGRVSLRFGEVQCEEAIVVSSSLTPLARYFLERQCGTVPNVLGGLSTEPSVMQCTSVGR